MDHIRIGRLKLEKSLTDFKMVAKTCEEYYQNHIRNFVFASSDSDVWALISSLPEADIMVLAERCKSGDMLIDALTQHRIPCVFMEDVQTDCTELMDKVVTREMHARLERKVKDARHLVLDVLGKLRLYPSDETFERYIDEAAALVEAFRSAESGSSAEGGSPAEDDTPVGAGSSAEDGSPT